MGGPQVTNAVSILRHGQNDWMISGTSRTSETSMWELGRFIQMYRQSFQIMFYLPNKKPRSRIWWKIMGTILFPMTWLFGLVELHHWDERWNMFSLLFKCPKRWLKQFEIADAIFQTNFCWTRKHDFEQGMVLICIVIFWFSNCKWFFFWNISHFCLFTIFDG